ncbi:MAG TPA: TfoX/Sxy family protein [Steroidobacteraceae bacterium]|nr:TfoX/Sxy family protein [Steroidobacteraceae bacterium]
MTVSQEFLDFVADQFACAGPVRVRRMFGGAGVYVDELFCAIVSASSVYLKVDERNRPSFEQAGMGPFRPFAHDPGFAMDYYQLPDGALEDTDELRPWLRGARAAALAAQAAQAAKRRRARPRAAGLRPRRR